MVSGIPFSLDPHPNWDILWLSLGYPMVPPSLGDLAAIVPQVQSLQELQQVLGKVDVRVSQPKAQL